VLDPNNFTQIRYIRKVNQSSYNGTCVNKIMYDNKTTETGTAKLLCL
jgi:hypothetical protein